jgi:DNA-binding MarR family transcriptional regulator
MSWALLTNHAFVLIHVAEHRRSTLREIAAAVGITERAALSILRALEEDGIITRRKDGRRNVYSVNMEALLAHRSHGRYSIEELATALFVISGRTPAIASAGDATTAPAIPAVAPASGGPD